jgi:hypothetical protein
MKAYVLRIATVRQKWLRQYLFTTTAEAFASLKIRLVKLYSNKKTQ